MADTTTRLYPRSLSRQALEDTINADEAAGLTLEALGHTATRTAVTYEYGGPPDTPVVLIEIPEGPIVVPPGKTKVCVGYVWLGSRDARVLAVR